MSWTGLLNFFMDDFGWIICDIMFYYDYSRVPNNRRGWNNRGVDVVIIMNNKGGWNNRGVGQGWRNSVEMYPKIFVISFITYV